MKNVFKILKYYAIIYIIAYLFKTFVIWEFTNPLQWIVDFPEYTKMFRGFALVYLVFSVFICFPNILKEDKQKNS